MLSNSWWRLRAAAIFGGLCLMAPAAQAGGKIAIDDTRWISIGAGVRGSFSAIENSAPNGDDWSDDFNLDNARIYINGQIHKYIKFEFNTECVFCGNDDLQDYDVLDAIAKFEFNPSFNIWAGRLLVPADRAEMSGPFYANTYDFNRTPFYPSDFSVEFGDGGAGVYGRDQGVNVWGAVTADGKLTYVVGVFNGLEGLSNQDDSLLWGGRVSYNFWNVEKNPGYYTSSTYYGTAGDILTVALAMQYQNDGAGADAVPADPLNGLPALPSEAGDFLGGSIDLLMEKTLAGQGVVTVEGEFKVFDSDYGVAAFGPRYDCFCMFDGESWTMTGLYLFPQQVGWGKFQPYVRYSAIDPDTSTYRDESEVGVNYVIDGHNARISLMYEYGNIATRSQVNFAPGVTGDRVSAIKLGVQIQL